MVCHVFADFRTDRICCVQASHAGAGGKLVQQKPPAG